MATVRRDNKSSTQQARGESLAGTSQSRDEILPIVEIERPESSNLSSVSIGSRSRDGQHNAENHLAIGLPAGYELPVAERRLSPGYKLASSIIPEYDGENIPVSQFIAQCRAAASVIEPHEIKYLILLIRTKVVKDARRYVWENGKNFDTLDALLEHIDSSTQTNGSSMLLLPLTTITRKTGETIAKYGSRTFGLLSEIRMCSEREHAGEVGKSLAAGMQHTAAKHFVRGLDRDTDKADIEARSWKETHKSSGQESTVPSKYSYREDHKIIREQVAYVTSDVEAPALVDRHKP